MTVTTNLYVEDIQDRVGLRCAKSWDKKTYVCSVEDADEAINQIDEAIIQDVEDWSDLKKNIIEHRQKSGKVFTINIAEAE